MKTELIHSLFNQWNQALQTGEPKQVAKLYADDAILLPTLSNQVRCDQDEYQDYFHGFLAKGPQAELVETHIRGIQDILINSGIYRFSFKDGSQVEARYTFVYQLIDGKWLIVEHHSSLMPE